MLLKVAKVFKYKGKYLRTGSFLEVTPEESIALRRNRKVVVVHGELAKPERVKPKENFEKKAYKPSKKRKLKNG